MSPETAARRPAGADRSLLTRISLSLGLLVCLAAFLLNIQRVNALGMDMSPPVWVIDAIPPALSAKLFGHPVRYTSLLTIRDYFNRELDARSRNAPDIDAIMAEIARLDPARVGTEYGLLGPDDKGIVDLVAAAFSLFGLKTQAVTWLYLVILLTSALALVVATRGDRTVLVWLTAFLLAHALLMPMVTYNTQLRSYLALRAVPVISMIACFHLIIFVLRPYARALDLILVVLQALLVVFAIHLRTTAQWQVITVALVTLIALAARAYRDRRSGMFSAIRRRAVSVVPLAVLVLGLLGLQVYRDVAYPEEYQRGDQLLTRVFWHNILSGFAYHPAFAEREMLRIDDVSVVRAVGRYLVARGRQDEWIAMGGEIPNLAGFRWVPYEPVAREYLIHTCLTEPGVCLSTTFLYKPGVLVASLAWVAGLRPDAPELDAFVSREWGDGVKVQMLALSERLRAEQAFAQPWRWEVLVACGLAIIALALAWPRDALISLTAGLALFVGSLLTTFIGYPTPWTIVDPALATEALFFFLVALGGGWLIHRALRAQPRRSAEPGQPLRKAGANGPLEARHSWLPGAEGDLT